MEEPILVTGGTGTVGREVARLLAAQGTVEVPVGLVHGGILRDRPDSAGRPPAARPWRPFP